MNSKNFGEAFRKILECKRLNFNLLAWVDYPPKDFLTCLLFSSLSVDTISSILRRFKNSHLPYFINVIDFSLFNSL